MKKICLLLCVTIFLLLQCGKGFSQRDCSVGLKISGERADGMGNWDTIMYVIQRCYDFDQKGLEQQLIDDSTRYAGYEYTYYSPPSQQYDCAGNTFYKLFGFGPYWITGQKFYDHLLKRLGTKITGIAGGWGDVQEGDVLVYNNESGYNHITFIVETIKVLGVVGAVVINTKDGVEGTYYHRIGVKENILNDPLKKWGDIEVYRIDPSKVKVNEVSRTCDCEKDLTGYYRLDSVSINPKQYTYRLNISKEKFIYERVKDEYGPDEKTEFTVSTPPALIKPTTNFIIQGTGTSDNSIDYHLYFGWEANGSWTSGGAVTPRSLDVGGKLGDYKNITTDAKEDFVVDVPDAYPKTLTFTVWVGKNWGTESTNIPMVQYFYKPVKK